MHSIHVRTYYNTVPTSSWVEGRIFSIDSDLSLVSLNYKKLKYGLGNTDRSKVTVVGQTHVCVHFV